MGKLAYILPRGKFNFTTSIVRFFKALNLLCIGCSTGEIIVYSFDVESNEIEAKLLLVPDPMQFAGATKDLILATSTYEEFTVNFIFHLVLYIKSTSNSS